MATHGRLPPRQVAVPNNYTLVTNGPIAIENGWATANLSSDTDRSPSPDLVPSNDRIVANPGARNKNVAGAAHSDRSRPPGPGPPPYPPPDFTPPPSYQELENTAVT